ncbi:BMP family lipoprotein [Natronincola ferrireducens]|uniref:Nucleoside-binding protein n=1 Tax=Natronincola ferrireducens TaxID=393762 RepID=A0A1G9HCH7_9FIRM|nr:BMP family ABC transporter substrate-binding protein [Natronincola ferrireducens]SDL10536.1 nucleoside-binding protein [Natronincola ferrireducens]
MKKMITFMMVIVLLTTVALTGCSQTNEPVGTDEANGEEAMKVALVVAGGLGDRSFYDSSNEGVERAKVELGVEARVFECRNDPSLYNDQLVQASQYASVVAVVGFEFYDVVQEIAEAFPEVNYIYVDNEIEGIPNLTTISYQENEGSFLVGAMAAILTQETSIEGIQEGKVIGMVGGMDIPVIRNFKAGYEAGAAYIDPEVKVETIFAGDFEDPAKGKESALALYSRGVDIIFQVAGKTGEGVFEAAAESQRFAIGVDSDQRYINPDVIVASMIKGVGLSIFESIERIQNGSFEAGKVYYYGIEENGVNLSFGGEDMPQFVTEEMKVQIEEIKGKIISGEIEVPGGK